MYLFLFSFLSFINAEVKVEGPRARQRSPLIENINGREEAEHSSMVKEQVPREYQRALIIMTVCCYCVRQGEGERTCGEETG